MTDTTHYHDIGLMVGLELHQQLDTPRKLFCHCPPLIRDDDPDGGFIRRLRPTQSEMGEIDPAALFEFKKQKRFYYEYYTDTTCLVEADEEPPHEIDPSSIDICLIMARFLNATPVDEIHPMRKIVIDGSNTTGFQRTAIIALGGAIEIDGETIHIQTICLEEDAARKIRDDEKNNVRVYRLDRLGIPLIEIATAPDIRTPQQAQEVALSLGLLLRSTGRVRRGLGTIRQDVNVSIRGGGIIEIKGLQQLDMLARVVELEALRQERLLEIRDVLVSRGVTKDFLQPDIVDVTEVFRTTSSKVIQKALKSGGSVLAIRLIGFHGLVGRELQPERRFGTELSDHAKFWGGVGGIFHSDELPKYGITADDVQQVRQVTGAEDLDAVVLVAAPITNGRNALNAVIRRAQEALDGVPSETRIPLPTGASKYARPRPGAERMYPETDVRPVKITPAHLARIARNMPETLEEKEARFVRELGLSQDLSVQIVRSLHLDLFETIVRQIDVSPTLVAVTLANTITSLHRDGVPVENITEDHLLSLFQSIAEGVATAQAIPDVLSYLAQHPDVSVESALGSLGLGVLDSDTVRDLIRKIVEARADFIRQQGERAVGGIMGIAMKDLRGKADGQLVKQIVTEEVQRILES